MKLKLLFTVVAVFDLLKSAQSVTNYTSGDYTIVYDDRQLPMFRIYSGKPQERLVWFSSSATSGTSLLAAAKITRNVTQIGGNFIFNEKVDEVCNDMKITQTGTLPPHSGKDECESVFFEGTLCGNTTSFRLTFQDTIVADSQSEGAQPFHHLRFNVKLIDSTGKYNQLRLVYGCNEDEQLYGFGTQYSQFNMKGRRLPVFLSEQGVGRGLQPFTLALDQVSPGAGELILPHKLNSLLKASLPTSNFHDSLLILSLKQV